MGSLSGKKNIFCRLPLLVVLLLCLAFLVAGVSAATRGVPATTTFPLDVPRVITTVTTEPPPQTVTCQAPCSCMERPAAIATYGADGFYQCSDLPCSYERTASGAALQKYCFRQKVITTETTQIVYLPAQVPVVTTTTPVYAQIVPAVGTTTANPIVAQQQVVPAVKVVPPVGPSAQNAANDIGTCLSNHGMGKGLPDTENETTCQNVCKDLPTKPQPGKDDILNLFEKMKKDHGYLSQIVTHPLDALQENNFRVTKKQLVIISALSTENLQGGFSALSPELQQQLINAGSGGDMATAVCSGEVCTTSPTPDGVPDMCDNCPTLKNTDQADFDSDGYGDVCDNCPKDGNDQTDSDFDNIGDTCDICPGVGCEDIYGNPDNGDDDNDGRGNCCDNCRKYFNPNQEDADNDGIGDACDNCWVAGGSSDSDGDCVEVLKKKPSYWSATSGWLKDPKCCAAFDNCPNRYSLDQTDTDKDGLGDACGPCVNNNDVSGTDTDGDGVPDACDNCPQVFSYFQYDVDNDNIGDDCDCNDGFKGFYEISTDCGVRKNFADNDPRIQKSVATGNTGCKDQPCSPCMSYTDNLPGNFTWTNWRGKNWMSPVKNQGTCGSCWVMAPIGSIEGMYNIHTGNGQYDFLGDTVSKRMIDMSEAYVRDNAPGHGCDGGQHLDAFNFINAYGVPNETFSKAGAFVDGTPQNPNRWYISGVGSVQRDYYDSLDDAEHDADPGRKVASALTCYGPLAVCDPSWEHCVTLVGWDHSKFDGRGGWLVKNSWGDGWPYYNTTLMWDRPDYWLESIPGLPGYAYIPSNPQDFNQNLLDEMWAERHMLHTGPKTYQGTWYFKYPKV
jgi:hypothetical protein